jgi:lipoate synthase
MAESLSHLGERRNQQASRHQMQAMQGLNEAAQGLQRSLSQLSGSASGTGFEQFMEQMQKMAGMQGQINEGTMNLFQRQGNQGKFSLAQQGEMRRLAARQRAVQQAMQELNNKMGNRDDVLGRLGELSGDMEEVVEDLLNLKVDRKTIDRQRQILSRMLDAQKSVREREYSKKRKAEQAKPFIAKDPGEFSDLQDAEYQAIQDALKQALKEGYGPDYQKLIEAYFKSLTEEKAP